MKSIIAILPLVAIFSVFSCNPTNKPPSEESDDPLIESIDLNYSYWTNTIFIAAQVSDPQGLYEGDSVEVQFRLTRPGSNSPDTSGFLYDDGTSGDIIFHDGVFSTLLDSIYVGDEEGTFIVEVLATDADSNSSGWTLDSLKKVKNSPPEVLLLYVNEEITQGDTIYIQCRVTDPQGYSDILAVPYYAIRPDSSLLTSSTFLMRDDGAFGDIVSGDGIFSVKQPTLKPSGESPGTPTGLWTIMIYAVDYSSAHSDTIPARVNILPVGGM